MAALSGGHLAVDFAGGALPALLPFFKDRFDLSYTLAAVLVLASTLSSSVIQPLFGLWSDRRGAIWLLPAGVAVGGDRHRARLGCARLRAGRPLRRRQRARDGRLPSRGVEVRRVRERRPARERDVVVLGRRQHRLRAGCDRHDADRRRARPHRRPAADDPVPRRRGHALAARTLPALARAGRGRSARPRGVRRGRDRPGAMAAPARDRRAAAASPGSGCSRSSRSGRCRSATRRATARTCSALMLLSGAVGTLARRPAADRIGRRPVLMASNVVVPPAILVFVLVGGVPGAIALVRDRPGGRRDVRRDDGDEPGVPAAPHRHGLGPVDRALDRARRYRGRHPRRRRGLGRPGDGVLRLRGGARRSAPC